MNELAIKYSVAIAVYGDTFFASTVCKSVKYQHVCDSNAM
jgi:hypothetical protein